MNQSVTPTIRPSQKQHIAWEALKTHKEILYGGAAGGGKSWVLCESRLVNCYFYPGYKSFIARNELKRLMSTTYITWCKVCAFHKIPTSDWNLNGQYNYIEFKNGSRIDLLDIRYLPSDPLFERFGGGEYSDGAIDEAGEIHYDAKEILLTRINRHMNFRLNEKGEKIPWIKATLFMTGNPKKNWNYTEFYKPWRNGTLEDNKIFIQAFAHENEYIDPEYIEGLKNIKDPVMKARLLHGDYEYDDNPNSLIDYDCILDSFTNEYVEEGIPAITADVAMQGSDLFVVVVWLGFVAVDITSFDKSEGPEIEHFIKSKAIEYKVRRSRVVFDADGLGAFLAGYLKGAVAFHANGKTMGQDKGEYATLKDQCGYEFARRMNDGGYYFKDKSCKDQMVSEIEQLQSWKLDDDKKLKILPKAKIKENIGRSPDYLDTCIMRERLELSGSKGITMTNT